MPMRWMAAVLLGSLALVRPADAGTNFVSTWKAPDAAGANYKGQKVVALVMSPEPNQRQGAEWALTLELKKRGVDAVPAYSIVPADETKDRDKARARFEQIGAVGVVVMRVTGQEKEMSTTSAGWTAPYYTNFWGDYYSYGWGSVYVADYLRIENIFHVETLVYNLKQGKLIWAGKSKTVNPETAQSLIKDLVSGVASEMKKAGLIKG